MYNFLLKNELYYTFIYTKTYNMQEYYWTTVIFYIFYFLPKLIDEMKIEWNEKKTFL